MRPLLEVIIKLSKHCNLRCTYCYEYDELSNPARISLAQLERLFHAFAGYLNEGENRIRFVWHGGEPMLIKLGYYDEVSRRQVAALGADGNFINVTQTNLTILTEDILDAWKSKRFFAGVGVSVDPFGSERIDISGCSRNEQVLANMQRLIDHQVAFGGITVLSRGTLPFLDQTFAFFDALGTTVRFLPFYMSTSSAQFAEHALSGDEIVAAYKRLFDLWLKSQNAIRIHPIHDYLQYALRYMTGAAKYHLDMRRDESWFIVGVDGTVWGQADTYNPAARYGNIFLQDFEEILQSPTRMQYCEAAEERRNAHCDRCPYYGYCPGGFVLSATTEERLWLASSGCPVRHLIEHILARLEPSPTTRSRRAAR